MVDRCLLNGLSVERASLYGMPHLGAYYVSGSKYARLYDTCVICGKRANNCHHIVPLSSGKLFQLKTDSGVHKLRSPLILLCGSGSTGCHNEFHGGGRYRLTWEWSSDEFEDMWWSGELLEKHGAHSDSLFKYGGYVLHDKITKKDFSIIPDDFSKNIFPYRIAML